MQSPGDPNPRSQPNRPQAADNDYTVPEPAHADHARPSNPTFDPPAAPGEVGMLGPYQIIQELGHGGMGAVYLAVDTRLQRKVALKVMLPRFAAVAASKERFLREARAAAQISHDNVVTVYEADERRGVTYIAMQFLKGTSLDDYLQRKGNLAIGPIIRVGREAAAGLAAAHRIGLVHRDIKPGNLWLEAPHGRVKVLDFGLAKPLDANIELTTSGTVVGTPVYMSPEQARGKQIDARSDLFSLGSVLYRLCSGQLPFTGDTTMAVLMALGTEEPKPLPSLNANVPPALASLIHQMLEKDPAKRPQTADDVARRMRAIGEEFISPRASALATSAAEAPDPQNIEVTSVSSNSSGLTRMTSVVHKTLPKKALVAVAIAAALILGGVGYFAWDSTQLAKTHSSEDGVMSGAAGPAVASNTDNSPPEVDASSAPQTGTKLIPTTNPQSTTSPAISAAPTIQPQSTAIASSDTNRTEANWIIAHGGRLQFNGLGETGVASELPTENFTVTRLHLRLSHGINNETLSHVGALTGLSMIDLGSIKVSDAGLSQFKNLNKLACLSLQNTAVTGSGMESLKDLKSLVFVNLSGCATDTGLAGVAKCPSLRYLVLSNTTVTDSGLAILKGMPNLQRVDLRQTRVTAAEVADFHAALPNCKVQYNAGVLEPFNPAGHPAEKLGLVDLLYSPDYVWSTPKLLAGELNLHDEVSDPFVSADGLTMWVAGRESKAVEMDIWSAHRSSPDAPWEPAVNAGPQVNTAARETMPQVSADGLVLTFWRDPPFKTFQAMRTSVSSPWSTATEVNGSEGTVAPVLSADGLEMFTNINNGKIHRQTRLYRRAAWQKPAPVTELNVVNWQEARWLSPDGRLLLYTSGSRGDNNYWIAHRTATGKPFERQSKPFDSPTGRKQVTYASLSKTSSGVDMYFMLDGQVQVSHRVPKAATTIDAERQAAEWILAYGGRVRIIGRNRWISTVGELPAGKFTINQVNFFGNKSVSDADIADVSKLPELKELFLYGALISDASMASLSNANQLTVLDLGATHVGNAGLDHLKGLTGLKNLSLHYTNVTEAGLKILPGFPILENLNLTRIATDGGLASVARVPTLQSLIMWDVPVTDAGLSQLKVLKHLTNLSFRQTKITSAGLKDFHAAVPNCRIEHDGGVIEPTK